MSGIDGTRTISIPSMSYNYVDNRLESIGTCGELYYRERGDYAPYAGTRWHELFGTPERAAQTLATQCFGATWEACDTCVFGECDGKLRNSGAYSTVYDTLLEWLKGEGE